jgi:hypothetical protein
VRAALAFVATVDAHAEPRGVTGRVREQSPALLPAASKA